MPPTLDPRASRRTPGAGRPSRRPSDVVERSLPLRTWPVDRIGQDFPQEQPPANVVSPDSTPRAPRLNDARVRDTGFRMAGDIHHAAALEIEGVRHACGVALTDDDTNTWP